MTNEEIHKLALEIRQALIPPRCVSTEIPRQVQEDIKSWCYGRPFDYQAIMPMGSYGLIISVKVQTSGEMALEIHTMSGDRIWRVYLGSDDTVWRSHND